MERRIIPFELRIGKDDDIAEALSQAVTKENNRSSIIRLALRQYLLQRRENINEFRPPDVESISINKDILDDNNLDDALDDLLKF